jgi:hypothetical protein
MNQVPLTMQPLQRMLAYPKRITIPVRVDDDSEDEEA